MPRKERSSPLRVNSRATTLTIAVADSSSSVLTPLKRIIPWTGSPGVTSKVWKEIQNRKTLACWWEIFGSSLMSNTQLTEWSSLFRWRLVTRCKSWKERQLRSSARFLTKPLVCKTFQSPQNQRRRCHFLTWRIWTRWWPSTPWRTRLNCMSGSRWNLSRSTQPKHLMDSISLPRS